MSQPTLLEVVRRCHNHDPWHDESFVKVHVAWREPEGSDGAVRNTVVGFIPRDVLSQCAEFGTVQSQYSDGPLLDFSRERDGGNGSEQERTRGAVQLAERMRASGKFPVLKGWRDELYAIYGPRRLGPKRQREILFKFERSACALFGFATFGVHCTGYTQDYKVWVPTRSRTKSTFPGMLDNTVAGGITAGESPFESMVRECAEEAGLEEEFVRPRLKSTGAISYFYKSDAGLSQPEVEYTYDLLLPADVIPRPVDGEAESFELMGFEEVLRRMRTFEFKPNCALVLIDFYIRHGLITPDTEPDYLELIALMHADLKLPVP